MTAHHRRTQKNVHVSIGIRTHGPSVRAAQDTRVFRPLGNWDQQMDV